MLSLALMSCEKKQVEIVPDTVTQVQTPTIDSSKAGAYKMVYCSVPAELNNGVILTARYKNWKPYGSDTVNKIILYSFLNNSVNQKPGQLRITANVTYQNEGVNLSQPYIEERSNVISYGFIECSKVNLQGGLFYADTMEIRFRVTGFTQTIKCKYKKQ